MSIKCLGPEGGVYGTGKSSPSCGLAQGILQGVEVKENLNFISSSGPNLANLSQDSQWNLSCSALFSPTQVYHWEMFCKS